MPTRQPKSAIELAAKSAEEIKQAAQDNRSDEKRLVDTMYARQQIDPNCTIDFLLISGGGGEDQRDSFGAIWKREHPNAPIPKTRYWVILNEYIQPTAEIVQPHWPTMMARTLYISMRSAATTRLRHLYAKAKLTKALNYGDVEVRWVAIPPNWKPLNDAFFDQANMRNLSDEGKRVGADANSWMTTAP